MNKPADIIPGGIDETSQTPPPALDSSPASAPNQYPLFQSVTVTDEQIKQYYFEPLSPCCPTCYYLNPIFIGVRPVKEKRPCTGKHVHAIARLYKCPRCGRHFVTAERIDSDPMPIDGKSPIGDALEGKIIQSGEKRADFLKNARERGNAIVSGALPRSISYPLQNGKQLFVFSSRAAAMEYSNRILQAVKRWEEHQIDNSPSDEPIDAVQEGMNETGTPKRYYLSIPLTDFPCNVGVSINPENITFYFSDFSEICKLFAFLSESVSDYDIVAEEQTAPDSLNFARIEN